MLYVCDDDICRASKTHCILFEGGSKKTRREVVTKQKLKHEDYEAGVIPVEWEGKNVLATYLSLLGSTPSSVTLYI